jgi:SAM-dependent methyltransferase
MSFVSTLRHRVTMNSSRVYLERFLQHAAQQLPSGSRVLDAGAGDCRYAHLFRHTNYIAVDFAKVAKQYGQLDVIADLVKLPFPEGSFDAIICTQVLEHLPQPQVALAEMYRLLRSGGTLWLTAPLYYEEHEIPFDFYRYTRFGLSHLLSEAGFHITSLNELEGYWGTLAYQWRSAARQLPWIFPPPYGSLPTRFLSLPFLITMKLLLAIASALATQLDIQYYDTSRWHCKNYKVVACKPVEST